MALKKQIDNSANDSEKKDTDGNSNETEHIQNHGVSDKNIQNILLKTRDTIFPPVKEEDIKGMWYAITYLGNKAPHTFLACLQKRSCAMLFIFLKNIHTGAFFCNRASIRT